MSLIVNLEWFRLPRPSTNFIYVSVTFRKKTQQSDPLIYRGTILRIEKEFIWENINDSYFGDLAIDDIKVELIEVSRLKQKHIPIGCYTVKFQDVVISPHIHNGEIYTDSGYAIAILAEFTCKYYFPEIQRPPVEFLKMKNTGAIKKTSFSRSYEPSWEKSLYKETTFIEEPRYTKDFPQPLAERKKIHCPESFKWDEESMPSTSKYSAPILIPSTSGLHDKSTSSGYSHDSLSARSIWSDTGNVREHQELSAIGPKMQHHKGPVRLDIDNQERSSGYVQEKSSSQSFIKVGMNLLKRGFSFRAEKKTTDSKSQSPIKKLRNQFLRLGRFQAISSDDEDEVKRSVRSANSQGLNQQHDSKLEDDSQAQSHSYHSSDQQGRIEQVRIIRNNSRSDNSEPSYGSAVLKTAEFQICVTIIECRQLARVNTNTTVCVQVGEMKKYTSIVNSANALYDNEYFVFDFHMPPLLLFDNIIVLSLLHSTNVKHYKNVIGSFKIDVATVWNQPDRQFYHKWAYMTDPNNVEAGPKAYLKVNISVVKKSDIIKLPPTSIIINKEDEEDNIEGVIFSGSISLDLNRFPRGAKSTQPCTLKILSRDGSVPMMKMFKQKLMKGRWPFAKRNNEEMKLTGKIEAEIHVLTLQEPDNLLWDQDAMTARAT